MERNGVALEDYQFSPLRIDMNGLSGSVITRVDVGLNFFDPFLKTALVFERENLNVRFFLFFSYYCKSHLVHPITATPDLVTRSSARMYSAIFRTAFEIHSPPSAPKRATMGTLSAFFRIRSKNRLSGCSTSGNVL